MGVILLPDSLVPSDFIVSEVTMLRQSFSVGVWGLLCAFEMYVVRIEIFTTQLARRTPATVRLCIQVNGQYDS